MRLRQTLRAHAEAAFVENRMKAEQNMQSEMPLFSVFLHCLWGRQVKFAWSAMLGQRDVGWHVRG